MTIESRSNPVTTMVSDQNLLNPTSDQQNMTKMTAWGSIWSDGESMNVRGTVLYILVLSEPLFLYDSSSNHPVLLGPFRIL
jgi:hypothetical protein